MPKPEVRLDETDDFPVSPGRDPARECLERLESDPRNHAFLKQLRDRETVAAPRFVAWAYQQRRNAAPAKPPVDIRTGYYVHGGKAGEMGPASWAYYDDVAAYIRAAKRPGRSRPQGIGWYIDVELDHLLGLPCVVGIDLDGCIDPRTGLLAPWALRFVRAFDSRTELSPSGTGVKIWLLVPHNRLPALTRTEFTAPEGAPVFPGKAPGIEIYTKDRYFTVTGMPYVLPEGE